MYLPYDVCFWFLVQTRLVGRKGRRSQKGGVRGANAENIRMRILQTRLFVRYSALGIAFFSLIQI